MVANDLEPQHSRSTFAQIAVRFIWDFEYTSGITFGLCVEVVQVWLGGS